MSNIDYDRMKKNMIIHLALTEDIINEFYDPLSVNRKLILEEKMKGDEFQENMAHRTIAFKAILNALILWDINYINYFKEKEAPDNAA